MALEDTIGGFTNNLSGTLSTAGTAGTWILYGLLLGALLYGLWVYLSYNVRVEVRERSGENGFITVWKKGRFKRDKTNDRMYRFQIMGDKRWNEPLDKNYLEVQKKAFGRVGKIARFAEDYQGRLQPIRSVQDKDLFHWSGWDDGDYEFSVSHAKSLIELVKQGGFWDKYGTFIQVALIGFIVVVMIVLFKQMEGVTSGLQAVADTLDRAMQGYAISTATNGTQVIIG